MLIEKLKPPDWKDKPKLISLFSGCGGLDLPFHEAGFELVWANDFNQDACATFSKNIAPVIVSDPVETVDISSVGDADIVTGGFPCQDFSIIWKKPGLDGERGNLYTYFRDFVKEKHPKAFVAENVKGLLSANNRRAIEQIISDFEQADPGYLVKVKLYNFAEYGVPQLRERVVLVGIRKDTGFNFVFPAPEYGPGRKHEFRTSKQALDKVSEVKHNNEHMKIKPRTVEILSRIKPGGNFRDIDPDDEYYVKGMISHVYRRLHPDKPSTTIIAGGGGGTWGYHYDETRALTNRERARIQTFPDYFEFCGTFGEIRRQIGNAVPPDGVVTLVQALIPLFNGGYEQTDLDLIDQQMRGLSIKQRIAHAEAESEGRIDASQDHKPGGAGHVPPQWTEELGMGRRAAVGPQRKVSEKEKLLHC